MFNTIKPIKVICANESISFSNTLKIKDFSRLKFSFANCVRETSANISSKIYYFNIKVCASLIPSIRASVRILSSAADESQSFTNKNCSLYLRVDNNALWVTSRHLGSQRQVSPSKIEPVNKHTPRTRCLL